MGNLESLPPRRPPLAPRPEGLGVYEDMLASGEGTVVVLDRYMQWQKDAVLLHTVTGVPVIQCLGYDTWNKKKVILDHEGNRLFRIDSAPMLSGGTKYFGVDTSENELFCLYSKGALTPGYAVEFVDHFTGVNRKIDVEGNYTKNVITLSSRGAPIGRIVRSWMRMEMGYGPGTYWLEVAEGVDIALLAAISICLDEMAKASKFNGRNQSVVNNNNNFAFQMAMNAGPAGLGPGGVPGGNAAGGMF
ncbi:uncharacterized protein EHS24_008146 [Apiotrichum porosum]|uniref:Phospholipid scramblase n=1 Tax=Apiotrichum porosum TaxID=105984 RepID=A0A427XSX8_9TREE|nr:uncharacterized protein EHS24_008146 [Apiotrichum porosum]RSH81949.1 hypothetical protein EHS24_008146 [Apiotrichum porosum]